MTTVHHGILKGIKWGSRICVDTPLWLGSLGREIRDTDNWGLWKMASQQGAGWWNFWKVLNAAGKVIFNIWRYVDGQLTAEWKWVLQWYDYNICRFNDLYIYNYKTSVSWMVQYRMPIILVEIEISGYSILSILCIWVLSSGFMLLSTCTLYNSKSLSIFHIFSLNLKTRTTLHKVSPTLQDPTESRGHCEVTWCGRVKWLLIMLLI